MMHIEWGSVVSGIMVGIVIGAALARLWVQRSDPEKQEKRRLDADFQRGWAEANAQFRKGGVEALDRIVRRLNAKCKVGALSAFDRGLRQGSFANRKMHNPEDME